MTGVTTGQVALLTGTDSDDSESFLTVSLTADLQTLDNLFNNVTGHNHNGAGKGAPITGTLTSPHMTSPVIDSGGLHVVSGQIYKNDGGALVIGTQDAQTLQLITNNLGRLTIDSNGQATFAQSLIVTGTTTFTGGLAGNLLKTGGALLVGTTDGQSIQLQTNSLGRLTIDLNGATTLSGSLVVQGTTTLSGGTVLAGVNNLVAASTDGYFYVAGFNGTPTGTPTAQAGYVAMAYSYTAQRLYAYLNGGWRFVALA